MYVLPREVLRTVEENPIKKTGRKKVCRKKSAEVIVLLKRGRAEQITVFKYTKITLIISQNVITRKVEDVFFEKEL